MGIIKVKTEAFVADVLVIPSKKKVILKVTDLNSLRDFQQKAKHEKLVAALITDSGRTKFHGTVTTTCLGIGPDTDELIDKVTHELKLL